MKTLSSKLLVVLLSLSISLLLSEVFLRFFLNPFETKGVRQTWEYHVPERNSLGLRDRDYSFNHKTFRILALGDSFTYGLKLSNLSSWPKQTEQKLHAKGHKDVEVLNAGRPGSDTYWQYQFLRDKGINYNPDLVIVGFLINDCTRLCSNCGAVDLMQELNRLAENPNQLEKLSAIYRLINLHRVKKRLTSQTVADYSRPYLEESETYSRCVEAFQSIKKLSQLNNFELIVVIYPMLYELNESYPFLAIHKKMLRFFREEEIEAYDLTPDFSGREHQSLWVSAVDSHPNREANEIVAERISRIVERKFSKPLSFAAPK